MTKEETLAFRYIERKVVYLSQLWKGKTCTESSRRLLSRLRQKTALGFRLIYFL